MEAWLADVPGRIISTVIGENGRPMSPRVLGVGNRRPGACQPEGLDTHPVPNAANSARQGATRGKRRGGRHRGGGGRMGVWRGHRVAARWPQGAVPSPRNLRLTGDGLGRACLRM